MEVKQRLKMRERGITLIALVITIIVLLILAAVTIGALTGDNGILKNAAKAKEETEQASEDELRKLTMLEAKTNLKNSIYRDKYNKSVTIPAGFAVSQVEGENTIKDGLVIIDTKGNEFVWVPVEEDSLFKRYAGYRDKQLQSIVNYSEPYDASESEKEKYDLMVEKVLSNNGFYIGRYEAGTTNASRTETSGIEDKVIIRKGAYVYNYIGWNNSENDNISDETGGAVEIAEKFAEENGYNSVTSTLIYGIQWDAAMNFIDPEYANEKCLETSNVRNSSNVGLYEKEEAATTGSNENYALKNIYDLAGNVWEWTMESVNAIHRVVRGGNYTLSGVDYPASSRSTFGPSTIRERIGFRIALYLN